MAGHPRTEFVLEAIQAAATMTAALPDTPERRRLSGEVASLKRVVESWRAAPPARGVRDDVMKRVLQLHVAAATLARLSAPSGGAATPTPAPVASASGARSGEAESDDSDRPTARPPFDFEAFARQASAPKSKRAGKDKDIEPITARRPSLSTEVTFESVADAGDEPSIEHAVQGAVEGPIVTQREIADPVAEMLEARALGDYAGAMALADLVLAEAPDLAVARACRESAAAALEGIYGERLGPNAVPVVVVGQAQLGSLGIDHRAGFLLSLVDGRTSIDGVLDVCGMPRLDALRILHELLQRGAIRVS